MTLQTLLRNPRLAAASVALGLALVLAVGAGVRAMAAPGPLPGPADAPATQGQRFPAHATPSAADPSTVDPATADPATADPATADPATASFDPPTRATRTRATATPATETSPTAVSSVAPERLDPELLEGAARQAPFHPSREAPAERYRLPADRVPPRVVVAEAAPVREEASLPEFRLLGVVATTGEVDPLVILQVGDEAPRVLSVGERIQGFEVAQVAGMSALLSSGDRNLRVTVAEPSASGGAAAVAAREATTRGGAATTAQARQRLLDMARQIQQQVGGEGGQVRVEGDRVMVTMPDGRTMTFGAPDVEGRPTMQIRRTPVPPTPRGGARPPGGGDR
jgi:hypothetical protein